MANKTFRYKEDNSWIRVEDGDSRELFHVFQSLQAKGFNIEVDSRILGEHPSIAKDFYEGYLNELGFKAHIYPAGFEIELFQKNNSPLDKYDYATETKEESYLIRLKKKVIMEMIRHHLVLSGFADKSDIFPSYYTSKQKIMHKIRNSWHYEDGIEYEYYEFPSSHNYIDRDGKQLSNGQVKYFRDYKGRLMRGTIYYNLNNMWWVVLNEKSYTNIASFDLFDLVTEEDRIPKLYSREIPPRIMAKKLRQKFNEEFSYSIIEEYHIEYLRFLISRKLANKFGDTISMSLTPALKKDLKILKTKGLQYTEIKVDGSYFSKREGITFNPNGFIGFAGWADGYNLRPFIEAFSEWMDWLTIEQKQKET